MWPHKYRQHFAAMHIRSSSGILLYGVPGLSCAGAHEGSAAVAVEGAAGDGHWGVRPDMPVAVRRTVPSGEGRGTRTPPASTMKRMLPATNRERILHTRDPRSGGA